MSFLFEKNGCVVFHFGFGLLHYTLVFFLLSSFNSVFCVVVCVPGVPRPQQMKGVCCVYSVGIVDVGGRR
jgi:hypothetical protein